MKHSWSYQEELYMFLAHMQHNDVCTHSNTKTKISFFGNLTSYPKNYRHIFGTKFVTCRHLTFGYISAENLIRSHAFFITQLAKFHLGYKLRDFTFSLQNNESYLLHQKVNRWNHTHRENREKSNFFTSIIHNLSANGKKRQKQTTLAPFVLRRGTKWLSSCRGKKNSRTRLN